MAQDALAEFRRRLAQAITPAPTGDQAQKLSRSLLSLSLRQSFQRSAEKISRYGADVPEPLLPYWERVRESATFGQYQPQIPWQPQTTVQKIGAGAAAMLGQAPWIALSYGLAAPFAAAARTATGAGPLLAEAQRGILAGTAYGAMRAIGERQPPSQVPQTLAQEAVLGMLGDLLGFAAFRAIGRGLGRARPEVVDAIKTARETLDRARTGQATAEQVAEAVAKLPETGVPDVDEAVRQAKAQVQAPAVQAPPPPPKVEVPKAEAPKPEPAKVVYKPKPGDRVRIEGRPGWGVLTVVDTSDPSLAVLRRPDGMEMKVGKAALVPVAEAPTPVPEVKPEAPPAKPGAKEPWQMTLKEFKEANPPSPEVGDYAKYGQDILKSLGKGTSGLSVEKRGPETLITYRDSAGNAVAHAVVLDHPVAGRGISFIAVDKEKGILSGKALREVLKEVEALNPSRLLGGVSPEAARLAHHILVKRALAEGKPVPPEVLKDYPDLLEAQAKVPAAAAKPWEGVQPGTEEWMRVWRSLRDQPEMQREMVAYAKRLEGSQPQPVQAERGAAVSPFGQGAEALTEQHLREVNENLGAKKQRLGFVAPGTLGQAVPRATDPKVEAVLNATRSPRTWLSGLLAQWRRYVDAIADAFVYHWDVRAYAALRNATRLFEGAVQDVRKATVDMLAGVVGDLDAHEYQIFRRWVIVDDLIETGEAGLRLPRDVTVEQLRQYRDELVRAGGEPVARAIERHRQLMRAIGEELVRRGKLTEEALRDAYYPHRVLQYLSDLGGDYPGLPKRLQAPNRWYTKERFGSVKDIDTDYLDVMFKHLAKVGMDNATDDFMAQVAREFDLTRKLKAEELAKLTGGGALQPGRTYEWNGKRYRAWQYQRGNRVFPAQSLVERTVKKAIEDGMTVEEWLAGEAGEPLRQLLALGSPHRIYLLPEEVARHLDNLTAQAYSRWLAPAAEIMSLWKRITLGFAGVPFQVQNFVGDLMNLYREDPQALLYLGRALAAMRKNAPEELKQVLELARQQRVVGSGLVRHYVSPVFADPRLAKLEPLRAGLQRWNPLSVYEMLSEIRENMPRLAKFMADLDRIKAGKQVVARAIDIKGLPALEAAGKVAREFTVDYGKLTPEMRGIRSLLFPFITFYVENAKNWARYLARSPGNALLKFGFPLGVLWYWNNVMQGEQERALPDYYRYMFHINTGYRTPDGKHVVVALQTPLDLAGRMAGIDRLPDLVARVQRGELTPQQAAVEQLKAAGVAPIKEAVNLLNPFLKTILELASNRDSFTGRTIVPERLKGTEQGRELQIRKALENIATPYAQYIRAARALEPEQPLRQWALKGPFDVRRGLGIREVDPYQVARQRFYEQLEQAEMHYAQIRADVEDAWIEAVLQGSWQPIYALAQKGVPVTQDMLQRLQQNPRVNAEIYRRALKRETDPARRQALEQQLRYWEQMATYEAWRGVPRLTRPQVAGK